MVCTFQALGQARTTDQPKERASIKEKDIFFIMAIKLIPNLLLEFIKKFSGRFVGRVQAQQDQTAIRDATQQYSMYIYIFPRSCFLSNHM